MSYFAIFQLKKVIWNNLKIPITITKNMSQNHSWIWSWSREACSKWATILHDCDLIGNDCQSCSDLGISVNSYKYFCDWEFVFTWMPGFVCWIINFNSIYIMATIVTTSCNYNSLPTILHGAARMVCSSWNHRRTLSSGKSILWIINPNFLPARKSSDYKNLIFGEFNSTHITHSIGKIWPKNSIGLASNDEFCGIQITIPDGTILSTQYPKGCWVEFHPSTHSNRLFSREQKICKICVQIR